MNIFEELPSLWYWKLQPGFADCEPFGNVGFDSQPGLESVGLYLSHWVPCVKLGSSDHFVKCTFGPLLGPWSPSSRNTSTGPCRCGCGSTCSYGSSPCVSR